jgi:hypothetical protein
MLMNPTEQKPARPCAQMNLSMKTLAVTVAHADGTLEYDAHNLYGMYEVKSTAAALRAIRGKRHFILTRCARAPPTASCSMPCCNPAASDMHYKIGLTCAPRKGFSHCLRVHVGLSKIRFSLYPP